MATYQASAEGRTCHSPTNCLWRGPASTAMLLSRKIPGFLEELWSSPATAVVVIWRGEALVAPGPNAQLAIFAPADIPRFRHRIYLGLTTEDNRALAAGTSFIAAVVDDEVGESLEPDVTRWMSARTLAHTLDDLDSGVVIEALAMANWHDAHAFSPSTGAVTAESQAGWTRVDSETGKDIFPPHRCRGHRAHHRCARSHRAGE